MNLKSTIIEVSREWVTSQKKKNNSQKALDIQTEPFLLINSAGNVSQKRNRPVQNFVKNEQEKWQFTRKNGRHFILFIAYKIDRLGPCKIEDEFKIYYATNIAMLTDHEK